MSSYDLERRTREVMAEYYCDWHYARRILARRAAKSRAANAKRRAAQHGTPAPIARYQGPKALASAPERPYRADIDGRASLRVIVLALLLSTLLIWPPLAPFDFGKVTVHRHVPPSWPNQEKQEGTFDRAWSRAWVTCRNGASISAEADE